VQCCGSGIRCFYHYLIRIPDQFFQDPGSSLFFLQNFLTLSWESLLSLRNWATLKTYSEIVSSTKKVCLLLLPPFLHYDVGSGIRNPGWKNSRICNTEPEHYFKHVIVAKPHHFYATEFSVKKMIVFVSVDPPSSLLGLKNVLCTVPVLFFYTGTIKHCCQVRYAWPWRRNFLIRLPFQQGKLCGSMGIRLRSIEQWTVPVSVILAQSTVTVLYCRA
jgi:hypothetical protein